jgi:hypothetical protein
MVLRWSGAWVVLGAAAALFDPVVGAAAADPKPELTSNLTVFIRQLDGATMTELYTL